MPVPEADPQAVAARLGVSRAGRRWRWLIGLGIAALVITPAALWLRPRPTVWVYETQPVTRGALTVEVTAVGTLEPLHVVEVGSEISGMVAKVFVETNDTVTAGQVLAELDRDLLDSELRRARATFKAAQATQLQARVNADAAALELTRARSLQAARAISDAAVDQAKTSAKLAAANVALANAQAEQAQAALVSAQTQSDRSTITSPLSGVVLARNVDPGQAVVSSLQAAVLFQVAESLDRMSVDVEVDEADIGQVRAGQTADFTVAAWPDRVFRAVVHKVELAPKADSLVATYIACLHLDNPDALLRPGMTATARIQTQTWIDALLVPNAALRWAPEDQADLPPPVAREGSRVQRVWRLAAGAETPEPVEIVTSATDGRVSLLLDGPLADGDALVVGAEQARQAAP